MIMRCQALGLGVLLPLATALAFPTLAADRAVAELINRDGEVIGTVTVAAIPHGVHIEVDAEDLPPGARAFHIHERGDCSDPEEGFTASGGHYNPEGVGHGWLDSDGPHAGDLPNVHVAADGTLRVEFFHHLVTLDDGPAGLLGGDGTAFVMHEGTDDYLSDPAGEAGPRIACGVIEVAG
jgi:superoxide dismutase, Cu-Zn family